MDLSALTEIALRIGSRSPKGFVGYLRLLPPSVPERLKGIAFRRTLRLAGERSAFYKEQFARHGIKIEKVRRPEQLGNFYTDPEELRLAPERFLCDRPEVAIESSGTTGHVARVFFSQRELDYSARQGIILKAAYGISAQDRIVSTFDYGFCLDGQIVQRTLPHWKAFAVCAGRADPREVYRRMADYRFNIVMSGTPWLSRFTEVAEAEGRPYPLKLLVGGGGGGITRRTRARIESFWEAPLCMTYGSTEAGTLLGFECLQRDGYHLNEFDFYVEILDPDSEGYGEIVMTTVHRTVMPLIRYRTRDVARIIDEPCPCGLPFRRLSSLRGRSDEVVASVWGNVHPDFFEGILDPVSELSDDWQVALQERNGKQTFEFRLELENGAAPGDKIREGVLEAVRHRHGLAWQAYEQGLAGVEFVFYPKGTLRKGRKLLRLVDERKLANSE
ncbi:MAG: phenylacetate--CoA ligase family protein [Deltaproteobacteria bacterium]|nr:phenylacetate--CoA ligase family protein [Deltaproteobacteria bacterium]